MIAGYYSYLHDCTAVYALMYVCMHAHASFSVDSIIHSIQLCGAWCAMGPPYIKTCSVVVIVETHRCSVCSSLTHKFTLISMYYVYSYIDLMLYSLLPCSYIVCYEELSNKSSRIMLMHLLYIIYSN